MSFVPLSIFLRFFHILLELLGFKAGFNTGERLLVASVPMSELLFRQNRRKMTSRSTKYPTIISDRHGWILCSLGDSRKWTCNVQVPEWTSGQCDIFSDNRFYFVIKTSLINTLSVEIRTLININNNVTTTILISFKCLSYCAFLLYFMCA